MDGVAGGGALQPKRLASVPVSDTNAVGSCAGSSSSSVGATCAEEGEAGADRAAGGVLVLAATSRRDMLDSALLRPGRLHESVEFGMPEKEDREEVLRVHTRRLPLAGGVDLERLSRDDVSGGLNCADLEVRQVLPGLFLGERVVVEVGGGGVPSIYSLAIRKVECFFFQLL